MLNIPSVKCALDRYVRQTVVWSELECPYRAGGLNPLRYTLLHMYKQHANKTCVNAVRSTVDNVQHSVTANIVFGIESTFG